MAIRENIIHLREIFDLTQEELAKIACVSRGAVSQWEGGFSEPRMGAIQKISDFFNIPKSCIIEEQGMWRVNPVTKKLVIRESGYVDIPLYGSIAAGKPIEMEEADNIHQIPATVSDKYPNAFLLKVEGESMNRILPNGCYALIEPCSEIDRQGQPYAVCVNGYDATIKRVRRLNNGFELAPDSNDPTYVPVTYNYNDPGTEKITVIGRVVYYVLPYDWEF